MEGAIFESLTDSDYHSLIEQNLNCTDYKLITSKCRRLEGVSGFIGEHYVLSLDVLHGEEIKELRFFVKSVSSIPSTKDYAVNSGALFKEEQMFSDIIPHFLRNDIVIITGVVPRYYLIRPTKLIIFEDLCSNGYRTLNSRESLDLSCVKVALSSIAQLHASALILEEKLSTKGKIHRVLQGYEREFREFFYSPGEYYSQLIRSAMRGLETQIDLFVPSESNVLKKRTEEVLSKCDVYSKPSTDYRNTICHGDLWIKNMMFKFEADIPTHCVLIDFQTYRYCPPAQDVMSFVYCSTDREFRKAHLQEVLDYYHVQLTKILSNYGVSVKDVVSYDDFTACCLYYKAFAIVQASICVHITMLTSEAAHDFLSTGCRANFFFEDRSQHILRFCSIDPIYRQKQFECVEDLQDIFQESSNPK